MADLSGRCPGCRRPSCDGCGLYRERKKEENGADEKRKLQALHTKKGKGWGFAWMREPPLLP